MSSNIICRRHCISRLLLFVVLAAAFATPVLAVSIPSVLVGDAGNAADTTGYGSVDHNYRMGTTEVTNAQYVAFLNAKAVTDNYALYNTSMGSNARGGITRTGSPGTYSYSVKTDMGNKPVNYVSWYDAIRFTNWLNNGQGSGDTETGAYTLDGGIPTPTNGPSITRNSGAVWFLTSEDEWYKAAYYQPAAQGGDSDNYWSYPTASNSAPTIATANSVGDISNPGANVANTNRGADWNSLDGNVTSVGSAGPLSGSFYGTFDQGGNVWEWNESLFGGSNRIIRGGSYLDDPTMWLPASNPNNNGPTGEADNIGFRVATVPEPNALALAACGALGGLLALRRRRRARKTSL